MTLPNSQIFKQLQQLFAQFIAQHQVKYQCLPKVEYDEQWPSHCQQSEIIEGLIEWQPVMIDEALSFENIEKALEISLNLEFVAYFSCFYSEAVPATCSEGYLELLFAWSESDFERLQQNLIGHVLMKQKLKQAITLFFAVTDEDDIILSVNNNTGEVWAEKVGCEPHKKLANSLSEFLASLTIAL